MRDDSRPCPVQTNEWDWGNVCPADLLGVHRCLLSASHAGKTGEPIDHICRCGTTMPAGRQPVRRG